MIAVKSFTQSPTFDTDLQAWIVNLGVPVQITIHTINTWQLAVIAQSMEVSAVARAQMDSVASMAEMPFAQQTSPPLRTLVADDGIVWRLGINGAVIKDTMPVMGIQGTLLLSYNHAIFVRAVNGRWYRWNEDTQLFSDVGMFQPGT